MAIFKKKPGGTKVGNALRSAFTVPAGSKPVIQINKPSIPTFGSSNLGNTLGNIGSTIKSGVSSIGSVQKPVSKFGTPTITPTVSKNTGVMSGSGQNMSPAIKSPNMSPAFIGPRQGSNRSQNMSPAIQSQNISPAFIGPMPSGNSTNGGGSWGGSSARNTVSNTGSRSGTSYSGTLTGGGSTGTGTGSLATPDGAATIGDKDFNYSKTPQQIAEEEALRRVKDYNDSQANTDTNYENIMRDTLRQFQGEIDATNQVYAEKLRQAGLEGKNRLGVVRSQNFDEGLMGSSMGETAKQQALQYNAQQEGAVMAEKLQMLGQIESSARELGNKYYQDKKAAKESGLAGYLENIKSAGTQKEAIAQDIATSMINSGLTVDEISPAKLELIAKNAGVPLQQIKNTFKAMQKAFEKESLTSTSKSASVQEYEYAKQNGYTGSFTDYQNEDANRKAVSSGSGSGGLTPYQQFQATQSIAKDTQKRTENAREMSRQANMISSGYNAIVNSKDKKNRSLQTQAIITSFNKILDPTSVVRESEYDRTSAGQSLLQRLEGKVNNIAQGGAGVTDATLKEASDIAKEYLKNSQASVLAENQRAVAMANQFGLNSDFVTTSYSGGGNSGSGGGGLYDF